MVEPALNISRLRVSLGLVIASLSFGAFLSGCQPKVAPAPEPEIATPAPVVIDETKVRLQEAEANLAKKNAELTTAKAAMETLQTQLSERDLVVAKNDTQIKALQAELEGLKKHEAFIFAAISGLHQQGQTTLALSRYQQFIKDFPKSSLVANAESAINQLTVVTEQETRQRANIIDPQRRQREFVQQFEDGFLSLKDLSPVLKKKTVSQVLALLGPPNRVFGEGTEIGYTDKAIDPNTGKRGMFIIAFEFDVVANLRVEYAGRRVVP